MFALHTAHPSLSPFIVQRAQSHRTNPGNHYRETALIRGRHHLNSKVFARRVAHSDDLTLSLLQLLRDYPSIEKGLEFFDVSVALLLGWKGEVKRSAQDTLTTDYKFPRRTTITLGSHVASKLASTANPTIFRVAKPRNGGGEWRFIARIRYKTTLRFWDNWLIFWRRGSESNRRPRLCRPLHDHSATPPFEAIYHPPCLARVVSSARSYRALRRSTPAKDEN